MAQLAAHEEAVIDRDLYEWSDQETRMLKYYLQNDSLLFNRYFFKMRSGFEYLVAPHHRILNQTMDRVFRGEIKRLIINISPGFNKTETCVINFMAKGFAMNPRCRFLHLSYSDELAADTNSVATKDLLNTPEFQRMFPMQFRNDQSKKGKWSNEFGGSVLATAIGKSVTGFRAGQPDKSTFTGAILIDDPIKPEDAMSDVRKVKINGSYNRTVQSRVMHEDVPIILVMQRVDDNDLSGYLLKGGSGEMWHHLYVPVEMTEDYFDYYPPKYTHGIPIKYDMPLGPTWEWKMDKETIDTKRKANPWVFPAQWMQMPRSDKGGVFTKDNISYYNTLPDDVAFCYISVDTASKVKTYNDYTVIQCWALSPKYGIFLVDQIRKKMKAPELLRTFKKFWHQYRMETAERPFRVYESYVEDTSNGTGLIQTLEDEGHAHIVAVSPHKDKVTRAMMSLMYMSEGKVHFPRDAPFMDDFEAEMLEFSLDDSHPHDDQIDAMSIAVEFVLKQAAWVYSQDVEETDRDLRDLNPKVFGKSEDYVPRDVQERRNAKNKVEEHRKAFLKAQGKGELHHPDAPQVSLLSDDPDDIAYLKMKTGSDEVSVEELLKSRGY